MYNSASSSQLGIFGDGWIYRTVLNEVGDHPLIGLRPPVDEVLASVDEKLRGFYSPDEGRPSISPSVVLKMMLLEHLYNLSDVSISRLCVHDFLFRWFVGLDPTESVPDHSTLARFRKRLGKEDFREIFSELVTVAERRGHLKGRLRARTPKRIDVARIYSNILKRRAAALLGQGAKKVMERVRRAKAMISRKIVKGSSRSIS